MVITVYSKPDCNACKVTKKQLDKYGLSYEVIDITENPDIHEYLKSVGHTTLPVVEVGDDSWSGFRPERIRELKPVAV